MDTFKCGFIGIGLIGGSIAKALKKNLKDTVHLVAFDPDNQTLQYALREKIVDEITNKIDETFSGCRIVFLCGPVNDNIKNFEILSRLVNSECIITDIGSVKSGIHEKVHAMNLDYMFIGGHPMAGSERHGIRNSKALILENAYYIITCSPSVSQDKIRFLENLITAMKSIPVMMSCREHDFITAAVSHLPHIVAFSLVQLVKENDSREEYMKTIAAGGFKDITRIASSSPALWTQICSSNSENIICLLKKYIEKLMKIETFLENKEWENLELLFKDAREYRDSFADNYKGSISRTYCIYMDIADEPGELAKITDLLAEISISIKNIGITHNREFQEGTLKIEFPDEMSLCAARKLLVENGYTVYEQ